MSTFPVVTIALLLAVFIAIIGANRIPSPHIKEEIRVHSAPTMMLVNPRPYVDVPYIPYVNRYEDQFDVVSPEVTHSLIEDARHNGYEG